MKNPLFGFVAAMLLLSPLHTAEAVPILINPADDGRVTPSYVITTDYLIAGDGEVFGRGILEFPTVGFLGHVASGALSINPYGLPLWAPTIRVYGYESSNGVVELPDYSVGIVLGDWTLPSDLGYGQDAFFDVSAFLRTVDTPFVGFVLQGLYNPEISGTGYDILSSLEYNLGHPAQLSVNLAPAVPEPATMLLVASGLAGMISIKKRRKHIRQQQ